MTTAAGARCSVRSCMTLIPLQTRYVPTGEDDRYLTTFVVDQDALRAHLLAEHGPTVRPGVWPSLRRVS